MSDDDLIRRGDALNAIKPIYGWSITAAEGVWDAIAALPAQGVREIEERKFYHDEWPLVKLLDARDLGNGLLTDDGEAWRYRLTHSDARGKYDVLYRPTRKLAALAPAEAGGVDVPAALTEAKEAARLALWCAEAFKDKLTEAEVYQIKRVWEFADCAASILAEAGRVVPGLQAAAERTKGMLVEQRGDTAVDALVKAAEEAAEVVHKAYVSATMEAVNAGPSHPLKDNIDKWRVRCLRAEEALRAALTTENQTNG